jgi:hypothetical protein
MIRILETPDEIASYMKHIKDNNLIEPPICAKLVKSKQCKKSSVFNKIKIAEERLAQREKIMHQREQDLLVQLSRVRDMETQVVIDQLDIECKYEELENIHIAQVTRKKNNENIRPVLQLCRKTVRELSIKDAKSHDEEECCPICFSDSDPSLKMVSFNCGHKFCGECTVGFLNKTKKNIPFNCPMCRGNIKTVQLTYTKNEGNRIDIAVSELGEKLLNACQTMSLK